jgi:hypothetical protein
MISTEGHDLAASPAGITAAARSSEPKRRPVFSSKT